MLTKPPGFALAKRREIRPSAMARTINYKKTTTYRTPKTIAP
jgi:hypothetical protein